MDDNRIAELEQWSQETGLPLPFPAEEICTLEDIGYIVELETGETFVDPDAITEDPDAVYVHFYQ